MFTKILNLSETASSIKNGEIDLIAFINDLCDRIDNVEPEILSLLPEENRRERLLNEAKQLLQKYPDKKNRPVFFGIPIGVKDIFRAEGFQTKCGSKLPAELFEGTEASCVTKLKNAGALILGKTVTTEFAYFEPGPTKNPNNTNYTPGGSSSGSASVVAAGFTPFAFGTQTIGSIIRPAAYCGVIGFKPSFGRISTDGVIPFSQSVDHIGFFTQDIEGCIMAASLLCENWNSSLIIENKKEPIVIGIPEGKFLLQASDEILSAFKNQIKLLEENGFIIKRIDAFKNIDEINRLHRLVAAADMAAVHEKWYAQYEKLYRMNTKQIIEEGKKIPAIDLENAKQGRFVLRNELELLKNKSGIDLWISPATLTLPPEGLTSTGSPLMNLPWTYAGLPAITIPVGKSKNNLPLGLQFCSSFNDDERFLKFIRLIVKKNIF
jgi:Asp-tRNA(Asn)/Glu-tRNA(Gln) amidotransferase A subunit family amidase